MCMYMYVCMFFLFFFWFWFWFVDGDWIVNRAGCACITPVRWFKLVQLWVVVSNRTINYSLLHICQFTDENWPGGYNAYFSMDVRIECAVSCIYNLRQRFFLFGQTFEWIFQCETWQSLEQYLTVWQGQNFISWDNFLQLVHIHNSVSLLSWVVWSLELELDLVSWSSRNSVCISSRLAVGSMSCAEIELWGW